MYFQNTTWSVVLNFRKGIDENINIYHYTVLQLYKRMFIKPQINF